MNEDNLNMEIRKFLKKVGISSQRIIENEINNAYKKGVINNGDEVQLEMSLKIITLENTNIIEGKIKID